MSIALREHEKLVRLVAKELEEDGYAVFLEPSPDLIPFSLLGYRPDVLATKADDNLIVEIKSRESPQSATRYRDVLRIIESHPGWRFLVKTSAELTTNGRADVDGLNDASAIEDYVRKAERVASTGACDLAVPYLWNAIVALLRHQLCMSAPEVMELSDRSLINRLYSLGEISAADYDRLRAWQQLRDRAVHDIGFSADAEHVAAMLRFARQLLGERVE